MKTNEQNTKVQTPKTKKGITLISLVITIIVLLILAGVAINMAINSDGLFGKAKEAAEGWNTAVAEEERAVENILEQYKEIMGENSGGSDDGDDDDDNDDPPALPAGWDSNKIATTVTEKSTVAGQEATRTVPIPKGFVVSQIEGDVPENTIAGGLVIYQTGDADVTAEGFWTNTDTDGNLVCQKTYNQFVWIPVDDINQMVMCKSNNSTGTVSETDTTDVCNIALQTDGTLKCETHNSAELCGRLYGTSAKTTDTSTPKIYTTSMNFSDRAQTWTDNSGYREPDIVSSYDKDSNASYLTAAGVSTASELASQLTSDFTAMAESVYKYGGFYVSRYEVGANGASLKNQKVLVSGNSDTYDQYSENTIAGNMWYGLYNAVRKEITVGTSTMRSHMIYGSQYDQIINFIGSEAQTGHEDRQLDTQQNTGYANDKDIMKNIYDLEGNNWEWTAQASYTDCRWHRGGSCFRTSDGELAPASHGESYWSFMTNGSFTTRSSLYL